MTDELAGRIVDAYKASPILTGLLLLNVVLIAGFGWWEHRRVTGLRPEAARKAGRAPGAAAADGRDCTGGAK